MKHKTPLTTTLRSAAAILAALGVAASSQAAEITKANNADNLNLTTSWVGGAVPGSGDVARWDGTVTDVNNTTNTLGANMTWGGIKIVDPIGNIVINSGSMLTNGSSGIDMSAATANLTLSNEFSLQPGAVQSWKVGSGRTLTIAGTLYRPSTNAGGQVLKFDTTAGGTINIPSTTPNSGGSLFTNGFGVGRYAPFPVATLINGTDFAGVDSSLNVVPASTLVTYVVNPDGATPNMSGAYNLPIEVSAGSAAGNYGIRLGATAGLTPYAGIRFNTPHPYRDNWTIACDSSRYLYIGGASGFLITTNVGTDNVIVSSSGGIRLYGGADFIIQQENIYGDLIITPTLFTQAGTTPYAPMITKTGAGRVVMNAWPPNTGPTRILEGTFLLNGTTTTASAVTVGGGATLAGAGSVQGPTTVLANGIIAPGNTNGSGRLTMSALTLNAGSQLKFYPAGVPTTNTTALLNLTNNLTFGGAVDVFVLSPLVSVGTYPLVKWTNTIAGTFNLAAIKPHVGAYLSNDVATTTLYLVVTNVAQPLTWATGNGTWATNGSSIWNAPVIGSTTYQETAGLGDAVLFEDSLSTGSPTVTLNQVLVPSSTTVSNITKNYTISGSGTIAGNGGLTKTGSGTLTLATANTFTGGINLNGGTTVFSALDNLGTGAVTFGGGTLQYSSNTDDISARTVTFGAGGGTIDVGANNVSFAAAVGNNGAGGLTKAGSGTLTLTSTNRYSGNTVVANGTLAFSGSPSISNSPAIILNSGVVLDTSSGNTLSLNGNIGQQLAGVGTLLGNVTAAGASVISPATNGTVGTLTVSDGALSLDGGTLVVDISSSTNDRVAVVTGSIMGSLALNSGTLQLNVSGTLPYGTYTLITYPAGNLSGAAANLTLAGFSQAGAVAELSDAVAGEIRLIVSAAATDAITWAGVGSSWDLIGTTNWYLNPGTTAWAFTNGDYVTFNDTGALVPSVSLTAAVKPTTVTVTSDTTAYSFDDGGGRISGAATLTKNGTATLTVNTVNDTTGNVVVNGGTLQVNGHLGTGNITNSASLILAQTTARTISGSVNGSGTLTRSGADTVTVTGAANYTGPTVITSGTLQFGNGGAAGVLSTTSITNDGTLILNSATSWTYSIPDTGTGILTKQGTNTVTLSGPNSRTGQTRVDAGKLVLGNANHLQGSARVEAGGTLDMNGLDQLVLGLQSTTFSGGLITNGAGIATKTLTVSNTATGYDCSASVQGPIAVVKQGAAQLDWRGASTYGGGTTIEEGTVRITSLTAFGTGPVNMTGGAINFGNTTSGYTNTTYLLPAVGGRTNIIYAGSGGFWPGPIVGTQDLIIDFGAGNSTFSMNGGAAKWAGVTNTVYLTSTASGWLRLDSGCVAPGVTFNLNDSFASINANNVNTWQLGGLVGNAGTAWVGDSEGCTVNVGYKNNNESYAGHLSGNFNWVKVGTGTWTLNGTGSYVATNVVNTALSYAGSTTVSNGTLHLTAGANPTNSSGFRIVSGATLDISGMGYQVFETNELDVVTNTYTAVTHTLDLGIAKAQTLSGGGTLRGSVMAYANSTINPGDGIGTLTVTTNVNLGGTLVMELNTTNSPATNDMLVVGGVLTVGGTLTVNNVGPALQGGETFKLFTSGVTGFTATNLPALTGTMYWTNNLAVDGTITVVNPIATYSTNITATVNGGNIEISWPATHLGWMIQTQANAITVGLSNNWVTISNTSTQLSYTNTIDPTQGGVFYRLSKP